MTQPHPFKPFKKTVLYEEVAKQIKQAIFDHHYQPGDRLPPERELCQIFNVGRPTVREALRMLSVMGLIDIRSRRSGATVRNYDIDQYMDAVRQQPSWLVRVDDKTIVDLWEVRRFLELDFAHLAAKHATATDLKRLEQCFKRMEACSGDLKAYGPITIEFYDELALCTGNKIFFMIWEMIRDLLTRGDAPLLQLTPPLLIAANKAIFKAVKSKDRRAIDRAMEVYDRTATAALLRQVKLSRPKK